jgi:hypothetical protein
MKKVKKERERKKGGIKREKRKEGSPEKGNGVRRNEGRK